MDSARRRSSTIATPVSTPTRSSVGSPGSRLSFGGSIRLNDLLNDNDYGFCDFASEAILDEEMRVDDGAYIESSTQATTSEAHFDDTSPFPLDETTQHAERVSLGGNSVGSTDSRGEKEKEKGKLTQFFDKAKSKLSKTPKEKHRGSTDHMLNEASQCMLASVCAPVTSTILAEDVELAKKAASRFSFDSAKRMALHVLRMPFLQQGVYVLIGLVALTVAMPGMLVGFCWGVYASSLFFLYFFVSEPKKERFSKEKDEEILMDEVEVAEEALASTQSNVLVYKGWMNELRGRYSPLSYHVNSCRCVLVRLEGATLRISRPSRAVFKHAFHEDPTLTQALPTMTAQAIYDLAGATVSLRPKRLAKRRWWSRKYPIYVKFAEDSVIETESEKKGTNGMKRSVSLHPTGQDRSVRDLSVGSMDSQDAQDGYNASDSDDEFPSTMGPRTLSTQNLSLDLSSTPDKKKKRQGIYLFARAAREKERWFHLLREACARSRVGRPTGRKGSGTLTSERRGSVPDVGGTDSRSPAMEFILYRCNYAQFAKKMEGAAFPSIVSASPPQEGTVSIDLGTSKWRQPEAREDNADIVAAANALATRIFFDFCRDEFWIRQVKNKIQTKLATIHLPYFIEALELSELDLGTATPHIDAIYKPKVDEWGLWVDFEMKYTGGIRLTLETRVNLLKLHEASKDHRSVRKKSQSTMRASRYSDEDLPESPESSPDEDFGSKTNQDDTPTRERSSSKLVNFVERAAQTSLFQKVATMPKIAKVMSDISSTRLQLNVEIGSLEGPMTVNLPPPPSDRIWYAFRKRPRVSIRAVPQVGDRSVDFTTVSDWIESKLRMLLEKGLVCPNMDDVIVPAMSGNELLHMGYNV